MQSGSASSSNRADTALRLVFLAALYGAAVFFAVAFSPAMGFPGVAPLQSHGKVLAIR